MKNLLSYLALAVGLSGCNLTGIKDIEPPKLPDLSLTPKEINGIKIGPNDSTKHFIADYKSTNFEPDKPLEYLFNLQTIPYATTINNDSNKGLVLKFYKGNKLVGKRVILKEFKYIHLFNKGYIRAEDSGNKISLEIRNTRLDKERFSETTIRRNFEKNVKPIVLEKGKYHVEISLNYFVQEDIGIESYKIVFNLNDFEIN